jgi:CRP-like cAMP-binding protein
MESYAVALNRETAKEKYTRLLKEQPQVIQRAPVQQIASYLGITRETLSRIRRQIAN